MLTPQLPLTRSWSPRTWVTWAGEGIPLELAGPQSADATLPYVKMSPLFHFIGELVGVCVRILPVHRTGENKVEQGTGLDTNLTMSGPMKLSILALREFGRECVCVPGQVQNLANVNRKHHSFMSPV